MVTVVLIANFILNLVERIAWLSRRRVIQRRLVGGVVGRERKCYCGAEGYSGFACSSQAFIDSSPQCLVVRSDLFNVGVDCLVPGIRIPPSPTSTPLPLLLPDVIAEVRGPSGQGGRGI